MDPIETQCGMTCRTLRPYEPETWCAGCKAAESEDREANMLRWRNTARAQNLARWEERFAIQEEARRELTATTERDG